MKNGLNLSPPKEIFVLNGNKRIQVKAETSYSVGLEFMEEERGMARKYHEEGMREES